jgi:hypothetical protein
VAVVVIAGLGEILSGDPNAVPPTPDRPNGPTVPTEVTAEVTEDGIDFSVEVSFPEKVTLTAPTMRSGQTTGVAWMSPLDDGDHEGERPESLVVPAGSAVQLVSDALPSCDEGAEELLISFAVTVDRGEGEAQRHRFTAEDPEAARQALHVWCSQGPAVAAAAEFIQPDGDAVVSVRVTNPGPGSVSVEVPAYADDQVSWSAAGATVPPGRQVKFMIYGSGVACEPAEIASWEDGRLLIDGKPFQLESEGEWCTA